MPEVFKPSRASDAAASDLTLEGVLESVTFANEETGWSVVRLEVEGRRVPVTAVGLLPGVRPGECLRLTGRWETDRRFGEQFKFSGYLPVLPATLVGMERYLASGLIRGIGKVMAARLVKSFGLETMDVIERTPERLEEVEGVGPARRALICGAWSEQRAVRQVMLFLQSHGVATAHAHRIWRQYGDAAIAIVRDNPYRLAEEVFGIGFRTADTIARSLGLPTTAPQRLEAGLIHALVEGAESSGHVFLPRGELVQRAVELLQVESGPLEHAVDDLDRRGLVRAEPLPGNEDGGAPAQPVYLAHLYADETAAAELLGVILAAGDAATRLDVEAELKRFEGEWGLTLALPQRAAVTRALTGNALVITGGPGTGKTTIINAIVRILEGVGDRVLLCAPTGRAAKRMEEATGRPAKTIHRLLEFNPRRGEFDRNGARRLAADLIIVDEMSMVDLPLFGHLLKAIPVGCRLILVGDVDQLPSVGPGSVLRDLIRSNALETAALTEIFRQAEASRIVVNAHRVNSGRLPQGAGSGEAPPPVPATGQPRGSLTAQALQRSVPLATETRHRGFPLAPQAGRGQGEGTTTMLAGSSDFYFIPREEPEAILEAIKRLVRHEIPQRLRVDALEGIQVLTPMHKGLLGTVSLNAELQGLLNPRGEQVGRPGRLFRAGDKVMQIRNNYELEVFNGDLGRIDEADAEAQEVTVLFDGRPVVYSYADLDELVLGYACSIHKSQGSEYPAVVIPLHTQHYVLLQRNLLYTAITRGRRLVVIVGSRKAAAIAVRNAGVRERHSRLAARLAEATHRA
ncbi:MAG: SF1B family DNA helicase RecD2 [Candidatus Methylomirabilia bacterium]